MSFTTRILRSRSSIKSQGIKLEINDTLDVKATQAKLPKKRKEVKSESSVTHEINIKQENANEFVADPKLCKLEMPKASRKISKIGKFTEKNSKVNTDIKSTTVVSDIENCGWKPNNWQEIWENILNMRKLYVAPVDSLGCEECPEKNAKPEIFRYQTLISVMLSSQTKDQVTYAATQRLIEHGLNIENILKTSDEKIGELIYPAGFWKSKVKFIKQTSQILKDQYDGDIPRTFKELCKLPGVGPKMANIVMSVGWNDTVGIAVDTHVHRISNRLGWVPKTTKDPEQTRKALESWLPKNLWRSLNIALVGFGQTICKPVSPSCENCLNKNICPFGKATSSENPKKKSKN